VGIDVTYVNAEVMEKQSEDSTMVEGIPTFVVEILSPNDTIEDENEKIETYLAARVPLVWIIDPHRRTVTVYRPDAEPELLTDRNEISADPHLPGFRVPVKSFFA
jgi:Uma2 family endonuclease